MEETNTQHKPTPGLAAFVAVFGLVFVLILVFQVQIASLFITTFFPGYDYEPSVLPHEWIILKIEGANANSIDRTRTEMVKTYGMIQSKSYDPDPRINALRGKETLKRLKNESSSMLYFINPYVAFFPVYIFISFVVAFLFSIYAGGNLGMLHHKFVREYERLEALLRKQFEAHEQNFDRAIRMTDLDREKLIQASTLPDIITTEVDDYINARKWFEKLTRNPLVPLMFYFRYRISANYSNIIQGIVTGGAGVLIFVIGLRGLSLIPKEEPSPILMALSLEFILLMVLMISFMGSGKEERLDRIIKELEVEQRDAITKQTESIESALSTPGAGDGGRRDESLADYEERRVVDEVLGLLIKTANDRGQRHDS